MSKYNPKKIEKKWQREWEKQDLYKAVDFDKRPKKYIMVEFPYPSGDGLHMGHLRSYCSLDALARKKRMEGFNVLFPMGWDAFGLPTENYAIKTGIHPAKVTKDNIATFKKQMKSVGLSFDWNREINSTDPKYYKWSQWIFIQLFKKGLAYQSEMPINWCPSCKIGLANEEVIGGKCERCGAETSKKTLKQWMLKITAYADRLIDDLDKVDYVEKIKRQQVNWIGRSYGTEIDFKVADSEDLISVFTTRADTSFGITAMVIAPEHSLLKKLTTKENESKVKAYVTASKKKSEFERTQLDKEKTGVFIGSYCINPVNNEKIPIWVSDYVVATYGGGAVMIVPAHDKRDYAFAKKYGLEIREVVKPEEIKNPFGVEALIETKKGTFLFQERDGNTKISPNKIGLFGGGVKKEESSLEAIKRELKEELNLVLENSQIKFIGVIPSPHSEGKSHNLFYVKDVERDNLVLTEGDFILESKLDDLLKNKKASPFSKTSIEYFLNKKENAYTEYGKLVNSGQFNGLSSKEAIKKITQWLVKNKTGKKTINYKLRDWVFSRQHYWGEPIPIVHCHKCGIVPVSEKDLPVELPYLEKYQPTDTGQSPLADIKDWVNTKCPKCGGPGKRETDTMPNWAGSSWYFLRYIDPKNDKKFADSKKLKYWLPVDLYNGGMEHTTLHLLYSRFWHKFLYDLGYLPTSEPYQRRYSHGVVLAEDNRKMSKSFGNIIKPNDVIDRYGADTLRIYEMFMGPFDQMISWSTKGVQGCFRFLNKVWYLFNSKDKIGNKSDKELVAKLHQTIKKVSEDFDNMKFNTAVASMMGFVNAWSEDSKILSKKDTQTFLSILSPFAPHICEEIWYGLGNKQSILKQKWPEHDNKLIQEETWQLIIQINGKVRDKIEVNQGISEKEVKELALSSDKIEKWLGNKKPKKVIYIPNRLVNLVI